MKVEIYKLPRVVGLGSPPRRIAEYLHVYPSGMVVASGGKRPVVFDTIAHARGALRYTVSGEAVDDEMFASYARGRREVGEVPCALCRDLHPEGEPEACKNRANEVRSERSERSLAGGLDPPLTKRTG